MNFTNAYTSEDIGEQDVMSSELYVPNPNIVCIGRDGEMAGSLMQRFLDAFNIAFVPRSDHYYELAVGFAERTRFGNFPELVPQYDMFSRKQLSEGYVRDGECRYRIGVAAVEPTVISGIYQTDLDRIVHAAFCPRGGVVEIGDLDVVIHFRTMDQDIVERLSRVAGASAESMQYADGHVCR